MKHPWHDKNYDKKMAIKREEKKWERIVESIDERDKENIRYWRGQEDIDKQYDGYGEYFD